MTGSDWAVYRSVGIHVDTDSDNLLGSLSS